MSTHQSDEQQVLEWLAIAAGVLLIGLPAFAVAAATGATAQATRWAVQHQLLTADHPRFSVPGAGSAGLDWARVAILAGVGVPLLVAAAATVWRRYCRAASDD